MIEEELIYIETCYDVPDKYTGKAKLSNGIAWFKNGKLNNETGPALIYENGTSYWCIDGLNHRLDGPAVYSFTEIIAFYIKGKKYLEQEYWNHPLVIEYKLNNILSIT